MTIDDFPLRAKGQRYDKSLVGFFAFYEDGFVHFHGDEKPKLEAKIIGTGMGYQGWAAEKTPLEYLAVRVGDLWVPAYRFAPNYAVCQLYSRKAVKCADIPSL